MNKLKIKIFILLLLGSKIGAAQSGITEDSLKIKFIADYLSSIYDTWDTTIFQLTKQQLVKPKSYGSNVYANLKDGKILRIVLQTFTDKGEWGVEYWFKEADLVFVYQTLNYFNEEKLQSKEINFKGMHYWESRYYFNNGHLISEKTTGNKEEDVNYSASDLMKEQRNIVKLFTQ